MDDDDNHDDDDDIIILAVNDNPVKVVTEFQVTLEIIKFIINKISQIQTCGNISS